MSEYTPDVWVMLKFDNSKTVVYKILAGWYGGYTTGDSWKLNSGVTHVEQDGDWYKFHGSSGSVYECHKNNYKLSGLTASILNKFYDDIEKANLDIKLSVMDEDTTNFMELNYA